MANEKLVYHTNFNVIYTYIRIWHRQRMSLDTHEHLIANEKGINYTKISCKMAWLSRLPGGGQTHLSKTTLMVQCVELSVL